MSMVGQATAVLERGPRRLLQQVWGIPDIHTRQKWSAVWPQLAALPPSGLHVLDAGCGTGLWSLEIAARRRAWTVVGVDCDAAKIDEARATAAQLRLDNAQFACMDFRDAPFSSEFEVVLSVASAHYLAASGQGPQLFSLFARWLRPGGALYLLGPRGAPNPFMPGLCSPQWHDVFSERDLITLSRDAGLDVEALDGQIGRVGIVAKQLAWTAGGGSAAVRTVMYPLEWAMSVADRLMPASSDRKTLMWLLRARRGELR
jgi:SAM-dependent methyltransferase